MIIQKFKNTAMNLMVKYGKRVPDYIYLKVYSRLRLGKSLNLKQPVTYNDKINWIKLNDRNPLMTICADKYEVRKLVAEKIGGEYLIPLLWHGEKPEEIPFENLPNSYVIKTNNASGTNIIVKDKNNINESNIISLLNKWLVRNYYVPKREWVYKEIKPLVICEEMLIQENDEELKDYRFFCFNGEPKFVSVDFSITEKANTRRNLYNLDWELMEEEITYRKELNLVVEKPEKLEEMISLSKKLAEGFAHVRIDFYYVNKEIKFGEMTFYHQSGMGEIRPEEFNVKMGQWLSLSKKNII